MEPFNYVEIILILTCKRISSNTFKKCGPVSWIPQMSVLIYDSKEFDNEVQVMMEIWRMRSSPLLPSLPDQLGFGVEALDRVQSMGQIKLKCVTTINSMDGN